MKSILGNLENRETIPDEFAVLENEVERISIANFERNLNHALQIIANSEEFSFVPGNIRADIVADFQGAILLKRAAHQVVHNRLDYR